MPARFEDCHHAQSPGEGRGVLGGWHALSPRRRAWRMSQHFERQPDAATPFLTSGTCHPPASVPLTRYVTRRRLAVVRPGRLLSSAMFPINALKRPSLQITSSRTVFSVSPYNNACPSSLTCQEFNSGKIMRLGGSHTTEVRVAMWLGRNLLISAVTFTPVGKSSARARLWACSRGQPSVAGASR